MSVKNSIFASNSERRNYHKLARQWGNDYIIYPNLPFLMVFNVSEAEIGSKDMARLKKTSIDYTFCDVNDTPIVCVEFDGLQQGVSIDAGYKPKKGFDIWRGIITELKLRIARQSNFPYIVVGDTEFADIANDIQLTVVDGIIGMILADKLFKKYFHERDFDEFLEERYGLTDDEFSVLPGDDQQDIVDKFGINAEVDAELDANPISRRVAKIKGRLLKLGELPPHGWRGGGIYTDTLTSKTAFIQSDKYGDIDKTVVIPKFEAPGLHAGLVARNIAELLAFAELEKRMGLKNDTSSP